MSNNRCIHIIYSAFAALFLSALSVVSCSSSGSDAKNTVDTPAETKVELVAPFDTDTAMAYIKRQVDFGPRVPGSAAHKACADWLATTLRQMGATVSDDTQTTRHPVSGAQIAVRNIFARFNPEATDRILVLAHYDTRPWADNDPDETNHSTPIDGANDGASGVAVALELARANKLLPAGTGLDILLVDQEDSGNHDNDESWCIGSRHWASKLPYSSAQMPAYAVLLDMVGGRDAVFAREFFSENFAQQINNKVWVAARKVGHGDRFVNTVGGAINDDHISLLNAGIPTVDIIETTPEGFNPTWHTISDNYENIDPVTIGAVGEVMSYLIYNAQ